jgi:pimeloyl-ACP methyl ester carboxylesterase
MRVFAKLAAIVLAAALAAPLAACGGGGGAPAPSMDGPIRLAAMGSFHVGGRDVVIAGQPVREAPIAPGGPLARIDPNGVFAAEHAYVQYFVPATMHGDVPLLLMHGGGMTGAAFETTPDGREGWLNFFLRRGWAVYNADAVERGRAGFAQSPLVFAGEPVFLAKPEPFERFRIGGGPGTYARREAHEGTQFPVEAYDAFAKQFVPRWTTTDAAVLAAYAALVERICPCVLLAHAQGAQFAFRIAETMPTKVRAIVAIEPAGFGDPAKAANLASIPVAAVYGDFIDQDARWPAIKGNGLRYLEAIRAVGGAAEAIDLPQLGILGNSHLPMMDKNNAAVAEIVNRWLAARGLWH